MRASENPFFILLLVAVSIGFGWILLPLYSAVLWGMVMAIIFAPLNRRFAQLFEGRRNLAALATLLVIVMLVLLPLSLIGAALAREASQMYRQVESGDLDALRYLKQIIAEPPYWISGMLDRFNIGSLADLQQRLTNGLMQGSQYIASQAIGIGQGTLDVVVNLGVMLYLLFFLLRDGDLLAGRIRRAIPLPVEQESQLLRKFAVVIRATVKGNMLIALIQGALGGVIFYLLGIKGALLWGVVMSFLSLLPAVGAGLVWLPVAIYMLATGSIWQGVVLIAFGTMVIGMVDNVLRPVLVGKDTRMPDYVVLISTLGGLQVFGLNGFIIGPVIAALFIATWDIYSISRQPAETQALTGAAAPLTPNGVSAPSTLEASDDGAVARARPSKV